MNFGGALVTPPQRLDLEEEDDDSTVELSVKNLLNETASINDWYTMGLQVDLPPASLKEIETTYHTLEKRKTEMFDRWLSTDLDASWEKLASGIEKMQKHTVVAAKIKTYKQPREEVTVDTIRHRRVERSDTGYRSLASTVARSDTGYRSLASTDRQESYKVDTNIVSIKFGILAEAKQLHTGDPVVCGNSKCTAVLNSYSVINEDEKVWECELCGTRNEVDLATEEIPLKKDVLYATQIATPQKGRGGLVGESPNRDAVVVFCMDTSGSMCLTTEVPGKFTIKGNDELRKLYELHAEGESQFLPRERRDISYVSRLQGVQAAVDDELTTVFSKDPKKRVALITFNSNVTIVGDGKLDEVIIAGDRLSSYEALMKIGSELPVPSRIGQVRQYLGEKLLSLQEKGQTALGPALLLSVMLAGKVPGSKVVMCTDGKANKGIGRFDAPQSKSADVFYSDLGILARDKSVTVSVLTIEGTETGLMGLGRVAVMTGGLVNTVNPLTIKDEFSNILSTPVIATGVTAKLVMHKDMYISTTKDCVLQIPVGNVTANTELSYTFGFRQGTLVRGLPAGRSKLFTSVDGASVHSGSTTPVSIGGVPHLPFQVQISYTALNGSSYLRVVTTTRPLAQTVEEAMEEPNVEVMGNYAVQTAATLAMEKKLDEAATLCENATKFLETHKDSCLERVLELKGMSIGMEDVQHSDEAARAVLLPFAQHSLQRPRKESDSGDDDSGNERDTLRNEVEKSTLQEEMPQKKKIKRRSSF